MDMTGIQIEDFIEQYGSLAKYEMHPTCMVLGRFHSKWGGRYWFTQF